MFFLCEIVALKKKQYVNYFLNIEKRKSKNYLLHPFFLSFCNSLFYFACKQTYSVLYLRRNNIGFTEVERSVQILNFLVSSRWGDSTWHSWSVPWSPRQCSQEFYQALLKSVFSAVDTVRCSQCLWLCRTRYRQK